MIHNTFVDKLVHHPLHENTIVTRIISELDSDRESFGRQLNMKRVDLGGRAKESRSECAPEFPDHMENGLTNVFRCYFQLRG